jgi:energy-coupling factor transporter ATP-binding protein EcfA2
VTAEKVETDEVRADRGIERLPWKQFFDQLAWFQGEHVTMVGPTGCGKSTLGVELMKKRSYVVVLGTKPTTEPDPVLSQLSAKGGDYRLIRSWDRMPTLAGRSSMRVVLWPEYRGLRDRRNQRAQLGIALDELFSAGHWAVWADELWILEKRLGLSDQLQEFWTQSRALKGSLIGGTQRPAHVSLLAYDQATHLFFWRDNDHANLKRIAGLGGLNSNLIRSTVAALPRHDALYVNTRTGDMYVTRAEGK